MSKRFKVIGTNDDQTWCDICGKTELKRVVWFEDLETGEVLAAGTTCAAKVQGKKTKDIEKEVNDFRKAQLNAAREEMRPFDSAMSEMLKRAPSGVPFNERLAFINSSAELAAFKEARERIEKKYNLEKNQIGHW